jgi:hypothetical protein
MPCQMTRSVHVGTNLSCNPGHRLPDGVVSLESCAPRSLSFFFPDPLGQRKTDSFFPRFAFSPSIVAHHRRSGQVFTQDQEEMILIGAFGLFWFGKSQVRFIIVPHSAGLPRRSANFCLRLLLSCMAGGPSFLGRHRRGTQGPRAPGVADASCSVIHMTSRDYSLLCFA